jgi:hypothetical protein
MNQENFRSKFEEALRNAGETLEDNGYNIQKYQSFVQDRNGKHHFNYADNPLAALDQTLEDTKNGEQMYIAVKGDEISDVVNNELDPANLIYRNVCGGIDLDEPTTQPEWVNEPIPAFGTTISYVPKFPDDYFEIGTAETQPPYTRQDAEERVEDIIEVLDESGFTTEKGYIE